MRTLAASIESLDEVEESEWRPGKGGATNSTHLHGLELRMDHSESGEDVGLERSEHSLQAFDELLRLDVVSRRGRGVKAKQGIDVS